MAVTGVRVTGLNEVVRALVRAGVEVDDLKEIFSDIAAQGADVASSFAPKDTGALAASVRGNRARNKAVIAAGSARAVPYAGPINYGWEARNIEPTLFMQRADEAIEPRAIELLDAGLDRLLIRLGL